MSTLASRARGTGIDPPGIGKRILMSKHSFLHVICSDDMKTVGPPLNLDINWRAPVQGRSLPVQVIGPYGNSKWLLVGLHPAIQICLECLQGCMAAY